MTLESSTLPATAHVVLVAGLQVSPLLCALGVLTGLRPALARLGAPLAIGLERRRNAALDLVNLGARVTLAHVVFVTFRPVGQLRRALGVLARVAGALVAVGARLAVLAVGRLRGQGLTDGQGETEGGKDLLREHNERR